MPGVGENEFDLLFEVRSYYIARYGWSVLWFHFIIVFFARSRPQSDPSLSLSLSSPLPRRSQSTQELLTPLRNLFLSLTTESNKTYWLVVRVHSCFARIQHSNHSLPPLLLPAFLFDTPFSRTKQATLLIPPILLGLAHYFQDKEVSLADKVRATSSANAHPIVFVFTCLRRSKLRTPSWCACACSFGRLL
jgi:hypothetical protein